MKRLLVAGMVLMGSVSWSSRPYRQGAVASAHPLASAAGLEMLQKGGNAVDAAVAAAFVLATVGPYHSGLGGGGFALVHDSQRQNTVALDFREVAPKAATRDMFVKDGKVVPNLSTDGGLAVAVPGAVRGYLELLTKYGKLKPAVVLAPAIKAAKEGFWVTPKYIDMARRRFDCLARDEEARRIFLELDDRGTPRLPAIGKLVTQPDLAKTLENLAKHGAEAFYQGPIAQAVVESAKQQGGILTLEDLASYKTTQRAPLEGRYRGHRILTMPPPSAGGITLLQTLGALETLGARGENGLASREVFVLHRYIEALRRSFVDRARYLGDPKFVEVPVQKLLSLSYLSDVVGSINPTQATPTSTLFQQDAAPTKPVESEDKKNTTHISVIDRSGDAVALTTTVNYWFGSCVVAKGTGILLNNQMDDFAVQPMTPNTYGVVSGEANAIAAGKIPVSSMTPTLVFSKEAPYRVLMAVGSPGGSTIPTTVVQVISHALDGPMDIARATSLGRIHHQAFPDVVRVEKYALEPSTKKALEAMGHVVEITDGWGDAEAVVWNDETWLFTASSDPRNEGQALGGD